MSNAKPDTLAIFGEALELESPAEVADYLDAACGGDGELRARVEALLESHRGAGNFLGGPPPKPAATSNTASRARPVAAVAPPIAEKPGTHVGRYKLLEEIGQGGFGVVYMAEQFQPIRRRVALKIIKPGMDTREVVARFEAERQALALMDHPNIARVFDGGATDSGRPYFVMELVKGVPLTDFCDGNQVSTTGRLELFATTCRAIQHAHQKGVIHRDIKPSNVMVTLHDGKPVPKVIDFGVAKAISQQLTEKTMFTSFGQMIGTPQYMSPEQAELSGLDIDTRSDIYSLGVLLYELLTGSTPLDVERLRGQAFFEMQRIIREHEPPRPSTRLSTLGKDSASVAAKQGTDPKKLGTLLRGELDWIVMKALEKDRARRYETANGLAADIQRYLNNEQVVACPPSVGYRLRKFARRNKIVLATSTIVAVTLLVGTIISTWQMLRANHEAERASAAEIEAVQEKFKADKNARDARSQASRAEEQQREAEASRSAIRRHAYVSDMRLASQAYEAGNLEHVVEILENHWPDPSGGEDVRGFVWYHWWQATRLHRQSTRSLFSAPLGKLAVAPNGRTVAVVSWLGSVFVYETDQLRPLRWPQEHTSWPWFSPDGAHLLVRRHGQIELRNAETLAFVKKMKPPENGGSDMLAFSSTRPLMASAGLWKEEARIVLWNTQSWEPDADWDPHGNVRTLTFSPDGAAVVTGMDDSRIVVWDVATRAVKQIVNEPVSSIVCSSHRGLFATANHSTVRLWNHDLEPIGEPFETPANVTSLAFSADGNRLVAGTSGDNRILVWDIEHQQPSLVLAHTIRGHSKSVKSVAFGGDNDTVWSSGDEGWLKQWHLSSCEPYRTLTHVPGASQVVYTDDGQTLLIIDQSGIAHRWQVEAAASLGPLNPGREYTRFAVSDDGSTLAGATKDGDLEIWDVPAGVVRTKQPLAFSEVQFLAVTPSGSTVVCVYGGNVVEVWDLDTGKTKHIPFNGSLPVISTDGRKTALNMWNTTQLWNIAADPPLLLAELPGWGSEKCKAFSPSGETLAVGSNLDNIRLHDTETGELKFNLKGHTGSVWSVAFAADGKSIVSGGDDRTVRIWDVERGNVLATFHGHASTVKSVDFSPKGTSVASCSDDGTVRIWTAADKRAVNQDIHSWIERVQYFTDLKDWKKAHEIMAGAVKLAPESPDVFAARARLYDRQGFWAYGRHGQTKEANRLWKAAIADCSRAIQLSPNDGKLFAQRGKIRVQHEQVDGAISDFIKALLLSKEIRRRASFMRMRGAFSLVPLVSRESQWRYTTAMPKGNWQDPDDFDDSDWKTSQAPFGWDVRTPIPATEWGRGQTDEIWLRHTFELDHEVNAPLILDIYADDYADIYINGVKVPRVVAKDRYKIVYCSPETKLRLGRNVLAVHCGNTWGYGKVDVSLRSQENEATIRTILSQVLEAQPDIEQFQQRRAEWQADRDRWQAGTAP